MFDGSSRQALDDAWDALTHLPTARRPVVESLTEVRTMWGARFEEWFVTSYIGLKRVEDSRDDAQYKTDLREQEVRVVFCAGK